MSKEALENYYKQLIKQKERETFLPRFNDYIEYLERNEECRRIISDVEKQKNELFKEKERLEKIVDEEIKNSKTVELEAKEVLKKYGTKIPNKNRSQSHYVEGLLNSESYPELLEIEKRTRTGQEKEIWGVWDNLKEIYSKNKSLDIGSCKQYVEKIQAYLFEKLSYKDEEIGENIAFKVIYSSYRKIIINGLEIKKLRMDSDNDLFFKQIYDNANKETEVKIPPNRTTHELINNIGFRKNAKKVFFQASGNKVLFRNPVMKDDLVKLGLKDITLEKLFPSIKDSDVK